MVSDISITDVVRNDKTNVTFKYRILNKYGIIITQQIPASQIITVLKDATITLDPASQTGKIVLNSLSDIEKPKTFILVDSKTRKFGYSVIEGITDDTAKPSDPSVSSKTEIDSKVYQLIFTSNTLLKTSEDTFTFNYQALNQYGVDITNLIPVGQITATTSPDSTITLDPLTETGTITYSSSDIGKPTIITLTDQLTGTTAVLNTNDSEETEQVGDSLIVSKLFFPLNDVLKTDEKTATFSYKILDNGYANITKEIPASDIVATALVGSTKVDVSLDPSTGTGTINHNFADTDKSVMVKLLYKTGVGSTASLNINNSESQNETMNDNDLSVSQISFVLTDQVNYQIFNKYGQDITKKIPASQIALSSSVNSMINLDPATGSCNIQYDSFNTNKNIILRLKDKLSNVEASENLGYTKSWKQDINKVINQIAFASGCLTKAGNKTALFHYRLLTQNGSDITEAIPVSQLEVTSSLNAPITFNPLVGIGAIHYNSTSDMEKPILITLADKVTGIKTSLTLKIVEPGTSSETESSKITKINISDKLSVSPTGIGYATYRITDQYGNDVTSSPLANSVIFESDGCEVKRNNGILTLTPNNTPLNSISFVVITAKDSATGVSTRATLTVVPMFQ